MPWLREKKRSSISPGVCRAQRLRSVAWGRLAEQRFLDTHCVNSYVLPKVFKVAVACCLNFFTLERLQETLASIVLAWICGPAYACQHPISYERPSYSRKWHGFYSLRREIATQLTAITRDPMALKGLLRHSSVNTTLAHYIEDVPEATAKVAQVDY